MRKIKSRKPHAPALEEDFGSRILPTLAFMKKTKNGKLPVADLTKKSESPKFQTTVSTEKSENRKFPPSASVFTDKFGVRNRSRQISEIPPESSESYGILPENALQSGAVSACPAVCCEPVRKPAEYRILLSGTTVTYVLTRKPVKNINLRVRSDGSVAVSAPRSVPLTTIEAFLRSKQVWLLRALRRASTRASDMPSGLDDGAVIRIFGQPKTLRFVGNACKTASVSVRGEELLVSLPRPDDSALRQRVLTAWLRDSCRRTVLDLCRQHYPRFACLGIACPTVRFRSMKTRWGSCQPIKGILTFNYALVHASPACIEYVVLHEFTHFLHPNHSPAFYACLSGFLPDWKQRRAELNRNTPEREFSPSTEGNKADCRPKQELSSV